jgi:hypothetical protein
VERKDTTLASDKHLQSNIYLCGCCGVVHLNYFNTTIRFTPANFNSFALMVNEAYHRLRSNSFKSIEDGLNGIEGLKF